MFKQREPSAVGSLENLLQHLIDTNQSHRFFKHENVSLLGVNCGKGTKISLSSSRTGWNLQQFSGLNGELHSDTNFFQLVCFSVVHLCVILRVNYAPFHPLLVKCKVL